MREPRKVSRIADAEAVVRMPRRDRIVRWIIVAPSLGERQLLGNGLLLY
jgi:hypothetical protein